MKKIILVIFSLLTVNCTIAPPKFLLDSESALHSVICEFDKYLKVTSCHLPPVDIRNGFERYRYMLWYFISEKSNKISLIIYFNMDDWAFFTSVYDSNGNNLEISDINRKVFPYEVGESITIDLNLEYLEKAASTGLDLAVNGKRGRRYIKIPAPYIAGFVKFIQKHQNNSITISRS